MPSTPNGKKPPLPAFGYTVLFGAGKCQFSVSAKIIAANAVKKQKQKQTQVITCCLPFIDPPITTKSTTAMLRIVKILLTTLLSFIPNANATTVIILIKFPYQGCICLPDNRSERPNVKKSKYGDIKSIFIGAISLKVSLRVSFIKVSK